MDETLFLLILVGVSLLVNFITLGMVISLRKKVGGNSSATVSKKSKAHSAEAAAAIEAGVVFCRNCGAQYDSTRTVCPHCETAR
ncbi:hypothetical protein AM500_06100 [Bacillus sp. FJAT-18017]|uniref:zinc ribbon domain-containing protein n=1 Tax=Bacillus sp. FJAT-18017 TaxID=1705566 RepID=UPI0006AFF380|nr:zinc ribbon domain-containing protein [Bacillus sp. FJAT-18017]ALC89403.1 hypothetical protein AM500_06100 [Bacillus sp. FJAT-18017]